MAIYLVIDNVGIWGSTTGNAGSSVLAYIVVCNLRTRIVNQNSVRILHNLVFHYPCIPTFNCEDALRSRSVYLVVNNHSVTRFSTTICNICLEILLYKVFLDVGIGWFNKKNALGEVWLNLIVADINRGTFCCTYTCSSILIQCTVFVYSCPILNS